MDTEKQLTVKEYLSQARRIDQRINSKLEQARSLREMAVKASSALPGFPGSATPNIHCMEGFIAKAMDLEREMNTELCRLIDTKREIAAAVNGVKSQELQILLELRYLCFKTWEEIAAEMGFDLRWVYRLHGRALKEIENIRHYRPL